MSELIVPSSPNDRKKLKGMINEITNCMARIEGEREAMKDIIEEAAEQFDIPKKAVRKVATTMFKHNYQDLRAEQDHFEQLYDVLVEGKVSID